MRIYRVSYFRMGQEHSRYEFFSSRREAERHRRENVDPNAGCKNEMDVIELEPTRRGILKLLNNYASHADNG